MAVVAAAVAAGSAGRCPTAYHVGVTPDRPVLFYDQDCRFCRASARAVEILDRRGKFALLPFSDPAAERLLAPIGRKERLRAMHIARPGGQVVSAGDALIDLVRILPGGGRIAAVAAENRPLRRLFRRGYQLVADRRGALSRLVPDLAPPVRRPGPG